MRAFCLSAAGVRFAVFEITATGVLLFECFFSSNTFAVSASAAWLPVLQQQLEKGPTPRGTPHALRVSGRPAREVCWRKNSARNSGRS